MLSLKKITGLAAAALMASTVGANAVVMLSSVNTTLPGAPIAIIQPTSTTAGSAGVGTPQLNVFGSDFDGTPPERRDPFEGTALAGQQAFHSVSAGSSLTYTLGAGATSFAITWGSPDDYNGLQFNGPGGASFDGNDVRNLCISTVGCTNPPTGPSRGFINALFTFNAGDVTTVVLTSTGADAFESFTPVPLPAAAWLLLAGLGGMGLVARRRKAA